MMEEVEQTEAVIQTQTSSGDKVEQTEAVIQTQTSSSNKVEEVEQTEAVIQTKTSSGDEVEKVPPPEETNNDCDNTDNDVTSSPAEATSEVNLETEESKEAPEGPEVSEGPEKPENEPVVVPGNKNLASEKLERVRRWSISKYKCTRQVLSEKLGRGSRTVDLDLEPRLELLRYDQQRFENILKLAQTLSNQLNQFTVTQKTLGDAFSELSIKTPTLHVEFGVNAEAQKFLSKNGKSLSEAITAFTLDINTLINKTIEDTMITAKQYEAARIEYDAYRVDLEELNLGPRDANTMPKLERAQKEFQSQKERYQRIRDDLSVKVKLLEENKVKVLHNQLWLLHDALVTHSLASHTFLKQNLQEAMENLHQSGVEAPSFLEES